MQLPIRLSFVMTLNKFQGQTLDCVEIYLLEHVFSRGQLYVALSRARTASSKKILIRTMFSVPFHKSYTTNIVYRELLTLAGVS